MDMDGWLIAHGCRRRPAAYARRSEGATSELAGRRNTIQQNLDPAFAGTMSMEEALEAAHEALQAVLDNRCRKRCSL